MACQYRLYLGGHRQLRESNRPHNLGRRGLRQLNQALYTQVRRTYRHGLLRARRSIPHTDGRRHLNTKDPTSLVIIGPTQRAHPRASHIIQHQRRGDTARPRHIASAQRPEKSGENLCGLRIRAPSLLDPIANPIVIILPNEQQNLAH